MVQKPLSIGHCIPERRPEHINAVRKLIGGFGARESKKKQIPYYSQKTNYKKTWVQFDAQKKGVESAAPWVNRGRQTGSRGYRVGRKSGRLSSGKKRGKE